MRYRRPSLDWQNRARCQGGATDPFYEGDSKRITACCNKCPVQVDCLEYALLIDERYGIWGGASEEARHRLRKLRGIHTAREIAEYFVRTGNPPKRVR